MSRSPQRRWRLQLASLAGFASLGIALFATTAEADPCRMIPDRGPMPRELAKGRTFAGAVTYVADGDSLCVALGSRPDRWAEVRLADVYAPELRERGGREAKVILEQVAKGRQLVCIADHRSYDRVVAWCRLGGRPLGDILRRAGAPTGGRGARWGEQP